MKILELIKGVDGHVVHKAKHGDAADVLRVVAADLMSDVLTVDAEKILLLTSLATEQSVRTAHILGAAGVVIANGKAVPAGMKKLAEELDVTLAKTRLAKFEACVRIGKLMVPA